MGRVDRAVYTPDPGRAAAYDELYAEYRTLHDYFGRGANDVMHRLKARRRRRAARRRPRAAAMTAADRGAARPSTALRREVAELHAELTRNGLVVWTAGNVSARVPGADLMVIKPSGVSYDELTPESMVVTDLDGNARRGRAGAVSDTAAHAYVYRHMPEVGGVVHTHSTYATAWAARGEPIPCVLTMIADEFGGEIPVGPFALIGDDSIGRGIVDTLRGQPLPRGADGAATARSPSAATPATR